MNWLETNPLSATTQALWFHLLHINNKAGWREWFTTSNTTLQAKIEISENTLIKHREILVEAGRIEYLSQGKKAGRYRIISLENATSPAPKEPEKPKEEKPTRQEDDKPMNPFEFYESNFGGTLNVFNAEKINHLIDDHGTEKVLEVMKEAVEKNKKSIGWVSAVLYNPINKGGKQDGKGNAGRGDQKNDGQSKVAPIFGTGRLRIRRNV